MLPVWFYIVAEHRRKQFAYVGVVTGNVFTLGHKHPRSSGDGKAPFFSQRSGTLPHHVAAASAIAVEQHVADGFGLCLCHEIGPVILKGAAHLPFNAAIYDNALLGRRGQTVVKGLAGDNIARCCGNVGGALDKYRAVARTAVN